MTSISISKKPSRVPLEELVVDLHARGRSIANDIFSDVMLVSSLLTFVVLLRHYIPTDLVLSMISCEMLFKTLFSSLFWGLYSIFLRLYSASYLSTLFVW